jgi:hypothetical protein
MIKTLRKLKVNTQTHKVNLTYPLLREDPSEVAIGITETLQEKHLKKKLPTAQTDVDSLRKENAKAPGQEAAGFGEEGLAMLKQEVGLQQAPSRDRDYN